jgi:thiamine-phosphate pyrophosphorylase
MAGIDEIIGALAESFRSGSPEPFLQHVDEEAVLDFSRSRSPYRGIYSGRDAARGLFREARGAWDSVDWDAAVVADLGGGTVVLASRISVTGRGSGIEAEARGAQTWTLRDGRLARLELHQTPADALRSVRLERLSDARLYFVCDSVAGSDALLEGALDGGADVLQLRDKEGHGDGALVDAAGRFRRAARARGRLFILNDRPDLVADAGADGVHVGQDDTPVEDARRQAGPGTIVGLSTHSPGQLDAACEASGDARPDYVSVGPVWETPTKEGRPAAGLDYVRRAAREATLPWFAIGGIDAGNVADVVAAGATRVAVVRAIRDAEDPASAARELSAALGAHEGAADDAQP